ncbi:hypothetical protein PR048_014550 [Dryococelus australis]|uniref:Uncharacterized protein n=1 Tax=Dryococelus australis TaxID=614101 RepID=A0ABQ9HEJ2_9NEOP|nr:hypothetical protein PR048_014550 [Dryococelus australis]
MFGKEHGIIFQRFDSKSVKKPLIAYTIYPSTVNRRWFHRGYLGCSPSALHPRLIAAHFLFGLAGSRLPSRLPSASASSQFNVVVILARRTRVFTSLRSSRSPGSAYNKHYRKQHGQGFEVKTLLEYATAVSTEQRRNERAVEMGNPRENPPTNGIVRRESHMRKSGVTRPGIEPGSQWWEASTLTVQPPSEIRHDYSPGRREEAGDMGTEKMSWTHYPARRGGGCDPPLCLAGRREQQLPPRDARNCLDRDLSPHLEKHTLVAATNLTKLTSHARLPPRRSGVQSQAGPLRNLACGNCAGRCRWPAGFLGDLLFSPPFHSSAAPYSPKSPSSALKIPTLSVVQISSLTLRSSLPILPRAHATRYSKDIVCIRTTGGGATSWAAITLKGPTSLPSLEDGINLMASGAQCAIIGRAKTEADRLRYRKWDLMIKCGDIWNDVTAWHPSDKIEKPVVPVNRCGADSVTSTKPCRHWARDVVTSGLSAEWRAHDDRPMSVAIVATGSRKSERAASLLSMLSRWIRSSYPAQELYPGREAHEVEVVAHPKERDLNQPRKDTSVLNCYVDNISPLYYVSRSEMCCYSCPAGDNRLRQEAKRERPWKDAAPRRAASQRPQQLAQVALMLTNASGSLISHLAVVVCATVQAAITGPVNKHVLKTCARDFAHPTTALSSSATPTHIATARITRKCVVSPFSYHYSPPTLANWVRFPACRTMPLVGGFSRDLPFPPPSHSGAAPYSPQFTHFGSQDHNVTSYLNLFTPLQYF